MKVGDRVFVEYFWHSIHKPKWMRISKVGRKYIWLDNVKVEIAFPFPYIIWKDKKEMKMAYAFENKIHELGKWLENLGVKDAPFSEETLNQAKDLLMGNKTVR